MKKTFRSALLALLAGLLSTSAFGQTKPHDLTFASLEDLMKIEVTSAGRKEQRVETVPAAVFVITQDDIRRSGIRSLPELFRLVPGMQVAQINSNNWAISVRGSNRLYANKLLVLIDGRSVYNRAFSGVFWSSEGLVLEDIERIEVIRGPGGAVWGANAVNGIVNIVTKSAADTKGALARVGGGTFDNTELALRYGGKAAGADYRVYTQWSDHGESTIGRDSGARDGWSNFSSGVRFDWTAGRQAFMTQGNIAASDSRPLWITRYDATIPTTTEGSATQQNGTILGRWTYSAASGASLQLQSFANFRRREDVRVQQTETIADVDLQYHTRIGTRHDVVLGGGFRNSSSVTDGSFVYSLSPRQSDKAVLNGFVEDEIALTERLRLTLGSKIEHDTDAGLNLQPTARVIWNVGPAGQHIWGAFSRAVRTPSSNDLGYRVRYAVIKGAGNTPVVLGLTGNPDYETEQFLDTEAGYRAELRAGLTIDITAFRGHYDRLPTNEPLAPVFEAIPGPPHVFAATRLANLLDLNTAGVEVAAHWTPTSAWRIDGSYSGLRLTPLVAKSSRDAAAARFDGNSPSHQWQVQSSLRLAPRTELNASVFHVGKLRELQVPAYTRADARVEFKVSRQLALIVTGQNLFDRTHREYATTEGIMATSVPRNGNVQLVWRF